MTPVLKLLEPVLRSSDSKGLKLFMEGLEKDFSDFSSSKQGFLSQLTDYVLTGSGKRVRPGLVYVCSQFKTSDARAVRETALAVEMIHIATLIHDDLVDEAAIRRQKPTVGVKFGEGAAVLLGDYVYAQAFQKLAALNDPELLRLFSETTMVMCEGEIEQLEHRYVFDLTEARYVSFLDKKTAALMAASCRAGARLGGLSLKEQDALDVFGRQVGIAFQIVDDILDLEGEEAVTGKTLRTDLTHGKMTLPLIRYAALLKSGSDRSALFNELKNPNGHMSGLIQRVQDSGAMDYCRAKVQALLAQAEEALATLPDHPSRRLLSDISNRLSNRQV